VPETGCIAASRGFLHVKEASAGHERLKLLMKAFASATGPPAFGHPVFGTSAYDVCIYDDAGTLAGALRIDRAGETCGSRGRSCWRGTGAGGVKYADPELAADGVRRLVARGAPAGGGQLGLFAKNAAQRGLIAMPTGITAALAGGAGATVQVLVSDGACFTMDAGDVRVAHAVVFRALAE
jgi:hypothetical protein